MYGKHVSRVDLEDLVGFFKSYGSAEAVGHVRAALREPLRVPEVFPGPSAGGGSNNHDQIGKGLLRMRMFGGVGEGELAKNAWEYSSAWLGCYEEEARDPQHRYLEGVLYWLSMGGTEEQRGRAHGVLGPQGRMSLEDLERFVGADFANVRSVVRSMANVAVYLDYMRWYEVDRRDLERAKGSLRRAVGWFYGLETPGKGSERLGSGEYPGWGVDDNGIPYQVDEVGKTQYWWSVTGNVFHIPYHAFSLQRGAMETVLGLGGLGEDEDELIRARREALETWFWKRGYVESEDPLLTGTGWTKPIEVLRLASDVEWEVGKPQQVNDETGTGSMLYPYWGYLYALKGRGREYVEAATSEMVEAFVQQTVRNWPSEFGVMLFSPELLDLVWQWKKREGGEEGDPGVPPEDSLDVGKLKSALTFLRSNGFEYAAGVFQRLAAAALGVEGD